MLIYSALLSPLIRPCPLTKALTKLGIIVAGISADDVTSDLHPRIYAALIGLSLWFVVWVWSFFGAGLTNYLLFIISGFIGVVIALQLILSSLRRPAEIANSNTDQPPSFHDWVRGDFDTEHGPQSGADAAIIVLLPILAAAIGMMSMMVFGIEFLIVEHAV
jgi:hypothetical protein